MKWTYEIKSVQSSTFSLARRLAEDAAFCGANVPSVSTINRIIRVSCTAEGDPDVGRNSADNFDVYQPVRKTDHCINCILDEFIRSVGLIYNAGVIKMKMMKCGVFHVSS